MARAAEEVAGIRLQQDRVSELMDELESEGKRLRQTERELLKLARTSGLARDVR